MSESFSEGDLIEAVMGDTVIRGRLIRTHDDSPFWVGGSTKLLKSLEHSGFLITVVERAQPQPPLPTEPGFYLGAGGALWSCEKNGSWRDSLDFVREDPEKFGPFTRLEPVPVTANRVLVAVRAFMDARSTPMHDDDVTMFQRASFLKDLDMLASQLGVDS